MNKGLLIVVSGPSGCGKGTVLSEVLKNDDFYYSVSATTRMPREGEVDGIQYHFMTKSEFEKLIDNNGMLEYAFYCDNYYGTPRKAVEDMRCLGKDVILEIEVKGAMKVMQSCPDAVFVFILPPSVNELERRLRKRGTEAEDKIIKRLREACDEIKCAEKYNYIIVNGELEKAVDDLKAVIKAEKLRKENSLNKINEVLENA